MRWKTPTGHANQTRWATGSTLFPTPVVDDHTDVASGGLAVCKHSNEKDPSVLTTVPVDG